MKKTTKNISKKSTSKTRQAKKQKPSAKPKTMPSHADTDNPKRNRLLALSLVAIVIIVMLVFSFHAYGDYRFSEGKQEGSNEAMGIVIGAIAQEGYVSIDLGNNHTLVLVPAQAINLAQEKTILAIMDNVKKNGFVSLYEENETMYLVEVSPEDLQ